MKACAALGDPISCSRLSGLHLQAAMQLSDEQVDAVCREYMAMMERCHAVYAEQQELLSGLAEFRRPSADWTGDPVRATPAAG